MARRMPSWSLPWHCLRAPAAVFRGRGSRCFVAVPLPAVGSLVQIGKDVIEADGAIRSLRADAALLDAAANSEHLALRPQERALAALFSADARETAAAWQGWVSGGPTARAIKTSDQRDPPAREDSSWLGLVGSAVSTAAETVQTVGATSVGTLGVAATAASKDLVGMETFAKELARQQLTLAWLGSMLSAHAAAGTGSGEELQEALVSRAKASGILKIHVVAEVLPPGQPQGLLPREERYVSVAWDTAWPSERVGSWKLTFIAHIPLKVERVPIASGLSPEERAFTWRPSKTMRDELHELSTCRYTGALRSCFIEVAPVMEGAEMAEPGGIDASQSKAIVDISTL